MTLLFFMGLRQPRGWRAPLVPTRKTLLDYRRVEETVRLSSNPRDKGHSRLASGMSRKDKNIPDWRRGCSEKIRISPDWRRGISQKTPSAIADWGRRQPPSVLGTQPRLSSSWGVNESQISDRSW